MNNKIIPCAFVALTLCPILILVLFWDSDFVSNNFIFIVGFSYFFGIPIVGAFLSGLAGTKKGGDRRK